jgi:hypothetical protein
VFVARQGGRVWYPLLVNSASSHTCREPEEGLAKSAEEIMKILETLDLTGSYWRCG